MSPKAVPTLSDERYLGLKSMALAVASDTEQVQVRWAEISHAAVVDSSHVNWRWLLIDMRNRFLVDGVPCPYEVSYLLHLAEAWLAVKGDFGRGVITSVLVEGRHLDNLLDLVAAEPGMTLSRMKAHVAKAAGADGTIEQIETAQAAQRAAGKERAKRQQYAEKIAAWKLDKADGLLPVLAKEASAYDQAIVRLGAEGAQFDVAQLKVALHQVAGLARTLEDAVTAAQPALAA